MPGALRLCAGGGGAAAEAVRDGHEVCRTSDPHLPAEAARYGGRRQTVELERPARGDGQRRGPLARQPRQDVGRLSAPLPPLSRRRRAVVRQALPRQRGGRAAGRRLPRRQPRAEGAAGLRQAGDLHLHSPQERRRLGPSPLPQRGDIHLQEGRGQQGLEGVHSDCAGGRDDVPVGGGQGGGGGHGDTVARRQGGEPPVMPRCTAAMEGVAGAWKTQGELCVFTAHSAGEVHVHNKAKGGGACQGRGER
mmetsp:Transcript_44648/g.111910  ORF Transcript_44648/g.111910 Transcript_44648/m.111910 type:complete len:249 (+) Transcript_44648:557-1303(+)